MRAEKPFNLLEILNDRIPLIGDGPSDIIMYGYGLPKNLSPLKANLEHPELVKRMHQSYLRKGAQLIRTNSVLSQQDEWKYLQKSKEALFNTSTALARESSSGRAIIAGRITGLPSTWSKTTRFHFYGEQAVYLSDTQVELLWLEEFSGTDELLLALKAINQASLVQTVVHLNLKQEYNPSFVIEKLKMLMSAKATFVGISMKVDKKLIDSFVAPAIEELGVISLILKLDSSVQGRKELETIIKQISQYEVSILSGGQGFSPAHIQICRELSDGTLRSQGSLGQ